MTDNNAPNTTGNQSYSNPDFYVLDKTKNLGETIS